MLDIRPFPPVVSLLGAHCNLEKRCLWGFFTALLFGLIVTPKVIRFLSRHGIYQVFRSRQQVHTLAILHNGKAGVPTMGGISVLIASLSAALLWASFNDLVIIALLVYLSCSLLGAVDDAAKIIRGNSKGLVAWQKLFVQALITWGVWKLAMKSPPIGDIFTNVDWPRQIRGVDAEMIAVILPIFYFLVIAGTSNGVNITDGIDGLAITNMLQCFIFFGVIAFFSCNAGVVNKSSLTYIGGASELAVLCACFAGGCLSFYWFNTHPAMVFMGDTGAIGLGGLLAIVAILLKQPFAIVLVGSVFVIETLSVALQVTSKKLFHKKIFLMAPLHHHFELKGYTERGIVRTVFVLQAICLAIAFCIIFYGCFARS
ncbi:MAG: phospho-N-acetylmuramoyl-pentapeptide-transferase [Puniceicoccales bacterium]|jgi:phospho-N-acetylmuramoyl-pentapeptide-transferase|nr:phospho-N-acetylmuramoyl-pentapeptide-transferase [Puniceicoccales bacterium]